ncbi:MAG: histidinol-phosphatase, partial [Bacteroidota bacterium]
MTWTNFHSHSHYCDGKENLEDHVLSALQKGFSAFGFSSHAPVDFPNGWSMREDALATYVAEARTLAHTYRDQIELYVGLEVDYIPGRISSLHPLIQQAQLDYVVGSVHFVDSLADGMPWGIDGTHQEFLLGWEQVFGRDTEAAIRRYFELIGDMVEETQPEVVGHLDKIKIQWEEGKLFTTEEPWYQQAVDRCLDRLAAHNSILEVNTRGIYKKKTLEAYPGPAILKKVKAR